MENQETKNEQYLKGDQDLIDRLNAVVPTTPTGIVALRQKHEMKSIQIEATLRSRKSMVDFDINTSRFSKILAIFAIIQIAIALTQVGLDILSPVNVGPRYLLLFGLLVIIVVILKKTDNQSR